MGDLASNFGGKVNGELIRSADWNGLIDAIEAHFTALETRLGDRLSTLETRADTTDTRLDALEARLTPLEALATTYRTRHRRLDLSTSRDSFAVGERAEIVARVTDVQGQPLDLSNAASRPWVDFVAVWGSLKAAPGFTSRAGTGGKTVSVRVNSDGEARAMLREETGEALAEEQELEVAAVLETTISGISVAQAFLGASTPAASEAAPAYAAISAAYERTDTVVMRNYLDGVYLNNPARSFSPVAPTFTLNWRDEYATVMAFVKPDDLPGTADGAMASGSIRVTFRDWVYPWIVTQYLPTLGAITETYRGQFIPLIATGFEPAVNGIFDAIEVRVQALGILGQQRELAAAQAALASLPTGGGQPDYLGSVIGAVSGGLTVQQSLVYSQAVAPMMAETTAPGKAIGAGAARGEAAGGKVLSTIRTETDANLSAAEGRILDMVRAENTKFSNDLLRENGPVRRAENIAMQAAGQVEAVNIELGRKAGLELVGQLLSARGGG